ncbi:MAG TPA: hypothetical protein VKB49_32380 [Candidatus Sulfotelmatobacter sp.]|nr:hypothetical protein [Candidatus Sulfotelmatobacter sp.]
MESAVYDQMIQLCALAAVEQDSTKLLVLVEEINRLLDEREQELKLKRQPRLRL